MPKVPLVQAAYSARSVIAEAQECINLYGEANPEDATFPFTYYQTPGLIRLGVSGAVLSGPVRGGLLWQGVLYLVVGGALYSVSSAWVATALGSVGAPPGPVSLAGQSNTLLAVWGANGYAYAPAGLKTQITAFSATATDIIYVKEPWFNVGDNVNIVLDDGTTESPSIAHVDHTGLKLRLDKPLRFSVSPGNLITDLTNKFGQITEATFYGGSRVDQVDGYFVLAKPNSNQFYISLFELPVFNPLDFAAKNTYDDALSTLIVMNGQIWLIGDSKSAEIWFNTGAADFTFGIVPGTLVEHGCVAPMSVVKIDLNVFWLAVDPQGHAVVLMGNNYQAKRVSTHAIDHAIQQYAVISDAIGMMYQLEGHFFYVLTFPTADATWVYDVTTRLWHRWGWTDNNGVLHRHRANVMVQAYGTTVVGDWESPLVYHLDEGTYQDDGQPIARVRSWMHLVQDNRRVAYTQFVGDFEVGDDFGEPSPPGQPNVSLDWSDSKGRKFGIPVMQSIGQLGEYLTNPQWRQLGIARDRVYRVSWSLNAEVALNGAFVEFEVAET